MNRPLLCALAAALFLLAPAAGAATLNVDVYLHETAQGLHALPETMSANVGDTLRLTVHNQGSVKDNSQHWLMVCGDGPQPPGFGSECADKWGFTGMIQNNQSAILTATAKKAGTFSYYCPIPGHPEAGMAGVLTVQAAGAAAPQKDAPGLALLGSLIALVGVALLLRKVRS